MELEQLYSWRHFGGDLVPRQRATVPEVPRETNRAIE